LEEQPYASERKQKGLVGSLEAPTSNVSALRATLVDRWRKELRGASLPRLWQALPYQVGALSYRLVTARARRNRSIAVTSSCERNSGRCEVIENLAHYGNQSSRR
jgi:hypothetical protein